MEGISLAQSHKPIFSYRHRTSIQLADIVTLSEPDFSKLISEIEQQPVFKKLCNPKDKKQKIITYRSFPGTKFACSSIVFNEEIYSLTTPFNSVSFIEKNKSAVSLIKKIGEDNFNTYFLNAHAFPQDQKIFSALGLRKNEINIIKTFVNDFYLDADAHRGSSSLRDTAALNFKKIAFITYHAADGFLIHFLLLSMARGRYVIDYDRFKSLKQSVSLDKKEISEIRLMFSKLELINMRTSLIVRILNNMLEKQSRYFHSGFQRDLVIYTQKDIAENLGVHPSMVSRGIFGKSIVTPQGTENPLEFFFPNSKRICTIILKDLRGSEEEKYSDRRISEFFKQKYNLSVSRRSVAYYRKANTRGQ